MEENKLFDWAQGCRFAVTICDIHGDILYMNEKSKATFAKYGNIIGSNLKACHSPRSWEMICKMLGNGSSNSYTITKNGVKKLIHQTPWYTAGGSSVGGLVEVSIELPAEMPHYNRDTGK